MRRFGHNILPRSICIAAALSFAACGDDAGDESPLTYDASSWDAEQGSNEDAASPDTTDNDNAGVADGFGTDDASEPEADAIVQTRNLSSREWLVADHFDELTVRIVAEPGAEPFSGDGTLDLGVVGAALAEVFGGARVSLNLPEGLVAVDALTLPDFSTLADIDASVRPAFDTLREHRASLYIIYIADFLRDDEGNADEHQIAAPIGNAPGWIIVSKPAARAFYEPQDLDASALEQVAILHAFAESLRLYDSATGTAALLEATDDKSGMHGPSEASITSAVWHGGEAQQQYIRSTMSMSNVDAVAAARTFFSEAELNAISKLRDQ